MRCFHSNIKLIKALFFKFNINISKRNFTIKKKSDTLIIIKKIYA